MTTLIPQIIINTEYFLNCAGSCSGCFLTDSEKNSKNIFHDNTFKSLYVILDSFTTKKYFIEHLIIGIGRGNNLSLSYSQIDILLKELNIIQKKYSTIFKKITFEISTSLIDKIDLQIEKAIYMFKLNNSIYFNIVLNSELSSSNFFDNVSKFYQSLGKIRIQHNFNDNINDIIVLNINPLKLPDFNLILKYFKHIKSPLNFSFFPYDNHILFVSKKQQEQIFLFCEQIISFLPELDLNIKNFISNIDTNLSNINDISKHINQSKNLYFFIEKSGNIVNGIHSIMGEVDFPRLMNKFNIDLNISKSIKIMQTQPACQNCSFQKECLISGSHFNLLANYKRIEDKNLCPSFYQPFLKKFLKN